jgi:hypothetical protein
VPRNHPILIRRKGFDFFACASTENLRRTHHFQRSNGTTEVETFPKTGPSWSFSATC